MVRCWVLTKTRKGKAKRSSTEIRVWALLKSRIQCYVIFVTPIRKKCNFKWHFYPPFCRLIKITLKHKKPDILNEAAKVFSKILKKSLGSRVIGPAVPGIPRVRTYYLMDMLVKLERNSEKIAFAKSCPNNCRTSL